MENSSNSKKITITPTIVIGLGGTGRNVLSRLKTIIGKELNTDIPVIKFLSFDTDMIDDSELHNFTNFDATEFHQLVVEDIQELLANKFKHPSIFTWFPHSIDVSQIKHGANQMRILGRLSLFWNIDKIISCIDSAVKKVGNLKSRTITQQMGYSVLDGLNIYLVSSTCGGTGSGMLIDLAYILRHYQKLADIVGVLLLPSAFHIEQQQSIDANGYATLQELEYYNKKREYSQEYGHSLKIDIKNQRPFNRTYLIDSWNENERHLETLDNVCEMCSETLFSKIFLGIYEKHRSIVDNIQHKFNKISENKSLSYSSFGHASLYFNKEKLINILSYRKLKDSIYRLMGQEQDTEREVLKFLKQNNLNEELTDDLINDLRVVHGQSLELTIDTEYFDNIAIEEILIELNNFEKNFKEQLNDGFEQMKKNCLSKYEVMREELLKKTMNILHTENEGINTSMGFIEEFSAKTDLFTEILEDEIEKYKKWKKNVFVSQKKSKLNELMGGFLSFFFKKSEIFSARDEVIDEINKSISYDIEIYSRELAIEIYMKLHDFSDELLEKFNLFKKNFIKMKKHMDKKTSVYTDPRNVSTMITDIEVLSGSSMVDMIYDSLNLDNDEIDEDLKNILKDVNEFSRIEPEKLIEELFPVFYNRIQNCKPLSFEELFLKHNVLRDKMSQLTEAAGPYWQYSKVYLPAGCNPDEIIIVSIPESLENEFRKNSPMSNKIIFNEQADKERVQVFRFKHGIPAHSLKKIRGEYLSSYQLMKNNGRILHLWPGVDKIEPLTQE